MKYHSIAINIVKKVGKTQKPTQLSPRSHPRHLEGKRTGHYILPCPNNFIKDKLVDFITCNIKRTFPSKLQLDKANVSDTKGSFLDLHLSIPDGFVKTKNLKFLINGMTLILIL